MKRKVLFKSPYLNIVLLDEWFYATEPANSKNNMAVAVLPYRMRRSGIEFLARYELNPAHMSNACFNPPKGQEHQVSIITGACETGYPRSHAKHELLEEAGYDVDPQSLVYCGTVNPIKSSCTQMYLFSVRIPVRQKQLPYGGDGTRNEAREYARWVDRETMLLAKDPYIHTIMLRAEL